MRYLPLLAALLCLACSKGESPPAAETETKTEPAPAAEVEQAPATSAAEAVPATLPPIGPPSTRLISAGEPPLRALRRSFKKGSKETVKVRTELALKMAAGESKPPPTVYTLSLQTEEVSEDGEAQVAVRILNAKLLQSKGYTDKQLNSLKASLARVKGRQGTYRISSRGMISDIQLTDEGQGQADGSVEVLLQQLIIRTSLAFPEEDVGKGAQWAVERTFRESGVQTTEVATVELRKQDGARIDLDATLLTSAPRQIINNISGNPSGGTIMVIGVDGKGTFGGRWRLGRVAPLTAEVKTSETKNFLGKDQTGAESPFALQFDARLVVTGK